MVRALMELRLRVQPEFAGPYRKRHSTVAKICHMKGNPQVIAALNEALKEELRLPGRRRELPRGGGAKERKTEFPHGGDYSSGGAGGLEGRELGEGFESRATSGWRVIRSESHKLADCRSVCL